MSNATAPPSGCIFCDAAQAAETAQAVDGTPPGGSLVLVRGRLAYVILNLYPYNNGHLMVAPIRHVNTLGGTTAEELSEVMAFVRDGEQALTEAYRPEEIGRAHV